jgi:hypothetical protein
MTRGRVLYPVLLAAGAALLAPSRAEAFEREWHLGGGLGVTAYPHHYSVGPALGLHAAYGISDVFDLKLELLGSDHTYRDSPKSESRSVLPYSAAVGLAYKLDVLQWIPYGGLLLGYQHSVGRLPIPAPFRRDDLLAALVLGLDYALSRDWGLGVSLRTDFLLTSREPGGATTTLLRAEYHWGF